MRVTTFVLPLAARALVAPRPHTKRLSPQRQAAALEDYCPPLPEAFEAQAALTADGAAEAYKASLDDPSGFWASEADRYHWQTPFDRSNVYSANFKRSAGPIAARWFEDGATNIAYNCLDRQVEAGLGDKLCFVAERNDEGETSPLQPETYTYAEALEETKKLAAALRARGVKKGDRVALFMPMVPELAIAMLACARIGAVHTVVFGGFSRDSLASRIASAGATCVIAADGVRRGGKVIDLWGIAKDALASARDQGTPVEGGAVILRRLDDAAYPEPQLAADEAWWHDVVTSTDNGDVEWMAAEDPLFILYTSGSTGAPKGIVHATGGYMVGAGHSFRTVFDAPTRADDVWFCTADCGWITGHTYVAYGPLLNGATQIVFEGVPSWPDAGRLWRIVDQHKVTHLYTAPTAIRALMRSGDDPVAATSRASLKLLGSVGEPINPEAWRWYREVVGDDRCPVADTWWQTETGVIQIAPTMAAGAGPHKPGAAMTPVAGCVPALLDAATGAEIPAVIGEEAKGLLVLKQPWPSMARTCWGDHERFENTYFSYDGYYLTGDGARRDADGHYWITGRVDDVVVVSGHNIGTAEVESALVAHPAVAEAALVGVPHDVKGSALYAFVTLTQDAEGQAGDELAKELKLRARADVAAFASPDTFHWAPTGLPKTRSGKIMRRILRKIAAEGADVSGLGDTSTLADPGIVDELIASHAGASK